MGVMAAVGYMAAETGSETQGGGGCEAGGRPGEGGGGATTILGGRRGVPVVGGGPKGGPRRREEWGGAMTREGGANAWQREGAWSRPGAGFKEGPRPHKIRVGGARARGRGPGRNGAGYEGGTRCCKGLGGVGSRPGTGPGPEVGGVARFKTEGQIKGRPLGGGARSVVWPRGRGYTRKAGPRGGPTPETGRTAPVPVYCWTPEKAGWRVSATVGL